MSPGTSYSLCLKLTFKLVSIKWLFFLFLKKIILVVVALPRYLTESRNLFFFYLMPYIQLFTVVLCTVAQSCLTLCDPMDYNLPDSSVHGISQAKILEWVAIFFRVSSWPRNWTCISAWQADSLPLSHQGNPLLWVQIRSDQSLSHVQLFVTPWIAACQAFLSITNSRSLLKSMLIE